MAYGLKACSCDPLKLSGYRTGLQNQFNRILLVYVLHYFVSKITSSHFGMTAHSHNCEVLSCFTFMGLICYLRPWKKKPCFTGGWTDLPSKVRCLGHFFKYFFFFLVAEMTALKTLKSIKEMLFWEGRKYSQVFKKKKKKKKKNLQPNFLRYWPKLADFTWFSQLKQKKKKKEKKKKKKRKKIPQNGKSALVGLMPVKQGFLFSFSFFSFVTLAWN